MKTFSILIVAIFLCLPANAQRLPLASKDEISSQLKAAPCKYSDRFEAVKRLFASSGASSDDMNVATFGDLKNLVVTKKGKSAETVIVGAHYDKVSDGCGAIDNWTGITTIANLYKTLRPIETQKTYVFVAFDREEEGLLGSNAMAKAIAKEERPNYCAMVNLDSFGFTYPQVMDNSSSSKLRERAESLAKELGMPFSHAAIKDADADSSSFLTREIPSITFHGLNGKWPEYLHSSKDKFENINVDSVFVAYNFILRYLAVLDSAGCAEFRKQ